MEGSSSSDKGNARTGTGTVTINILDVNDNIPELDEKSVSVFPWIHLLLWITNGMCLIMKLIYIICSKNKDISKHSVANPTHCLGKKFPRNSAATSMLWILKIRQKHTLTSSVLNIRSDAL